MLKSVAPIWGRLRHLHRPAMLKCIAKAAPIQTSRRWDSSLPKKWRRASVLGSS